MTHSAASVLEDELTSSAPSPYMDSEERFLGVVCERKGCVAKVKSRAEW
jgi:hypothetical protein